MIFPRIPNGSDILDKVSSMKLICNYYIRNYGSVLQSYASFIAIKKFDSRVTVINYVDRPDNMAKAEIAIRIKTKYLLNFSMLINKIRKIICGDDEYEYIVSKRGIEFDSFIQKSFIFTQQYNSPLEIAVNLQEKEIVVIGSDQLWGPEDIIRDYHTLNWVPTDHKTVSYATSFGVSELPKFVCERAKRFLKKITCISVRESAGVKIVNDLISRVVPQVCDPTLLLKKQEWESIASDRMINEPYIFCFFIGDNPWQREKAIKLRETTGYKIVAILHLDQYIPSDNGYADYEFNNAGPEDFLSLIKYAEYVMCDSFHASIFSILFEKKFLVYNRYAINTFGSRNSRIDSLCQKLGLNDRRANKDDDVILKISSEIDYLQVNKIIKKWRIESYDYMKKSLEE